jgi:hypothetical protein
MSLGERVRTAAHGVILAAAASLVPDLSLPFSSDAQEARSQAIARSVLRGVAALGHEPESAPFAHDHFFRAVRRSGLPRRKQEYLLRLARRADEAGRLEASHQSLGHVHRKGQPRRKERVGTGMRTSKRHVRYIPTRAKIAAGDRAAPRAPRLAIDGWVFVIPPPVRAADRIGPITQTVWQLVIPPGSADQAERDQAERDAGDAPRPRPARPASPAHADHADHADTTPAYSDQEVTWIRAALAALTEARPAGPWAAPTYLERVFRLGHDAKKNGATVANAVWGAVGFARTAKRPQSDDALDHRLEGFIQDEFRVERPTKAPPVKPPVKVAARDSLAADAERAAAAAPPPARHQLDPDAQGRLNRLLGLMPPAPTPASSPAPAASPPAVPRLRDALGVPDAVDDPAPDGARGPSPRA